MMKVMNKRNLHEGTLRMLIMILSIFEKELRVCKGEFYLERLNLSLHLHNEFPRLSLLISRHL